MKTRPGIFDAVRDVLRTVGPSCTFEVWQRLPQYEKRDIARVLGQLRQCVRGERVYIHDWSREPVTPGGRRVLRMVFALGNKPDAKRPPTIGANAARDAYRRRRRVEPKHTVLVSSVFDLWRAL